MIVRLIVWTFGIFSALAQDTGSSEQWAVYLATHRIPEIADRMSSPDWPRLSSRNPEDRKLALALLQKLREEHAGRLQDVSDEGIRRSREVSAKFRSAGGYLNAVLGDAVFRIAVADLATLAVREPLRAKEVESYLKTLGSPWTPEEVDRLLREFIGAGAASEIMKGKDDEFMLRLSRRFGGREPWGAEARSSALIAEELPADLVYRMMETDYVATCALPGMVTYLSRGGRLDELTDRDRSRFDKVMGAESVGFSFMKLGMAGLTGGDVMSLAKDFGESGQHSRFLKASLD